MRKTKILIRTEKIKRIGIKKSKDNDLNCF